MKPDKMLVLTSLAAGAMVACGSAFSQETVSSMTTNATSHISNMFKGSSSSSSMVDKLSAKLGLTDDQKEKVQSLFKSEHQQMQNVHQDTTLSTGQARSKTEEIHDSMDSKMKSILTAEQYQKWEKLSHPSHILPSGSANPPSGSP